MLARGIVPEARPWAPAAPAGEWPDDLAEIVYVDRFGNLLTGIRASRVPRSARLQFGDNLLTHARTYGEVATGQGFWYENANGLVEIAVNQERADRCLGCGVGTPVDVVLE
jgi:S-adenosylmethionine hydrolase